MTTRKGIQPFFFSAEDEVLLSSAFLKIAPKLRFLDDNRWDGPEPKCCASIEACRSRFVYLWDFSQVPDLPTSVINGRLQGPASGVVIQFMRSRLDNGVLLSGQMGVGYTAEWVGTLWKALLSAARAVSTRKLISQAQSAEVTSAYLVGPGARAFSFDGGPLKHTAAEVVYRAL